MGSEKKWIYLSYVVAALVVAWVLHRTLGLLAGILSLPNPMFLGVLRYSTVIAAVAVGIAASVYFRREKVNTFSTEVLQEMKKVTWPVRKNVYMSTLVVVVCVIIVAVVLALYDWICASLIGFALRI